MQLRGVDVAVERQDAAGGLVDGRVADEGTSHEVALDIPESAQLEPRAVFKPEDPQVGLECRRGGHVRAVGGSRDAGRELVAGGRQGCGRERLRPGVGIGVEEEPLAGGRIFVARPEKVGLAGGEQIAFGDVHADTEGLADGLLDAGVAELGIVGHVAVTLGHLQHANQLGTVLREVLHDRTVVGSLQRQDDLRLRGDVVLHGHGGLLHGGVDQHLEDVAVLGDHVAESALGDAQHVEERFGLVDIGNRRREDRAQRVAHFARPLRLRADENQLVGFALRGFDVGVAQRAEGVATGGQRGEKENDRQTDKSFHGRDVFWANILIFSQTV